MQMIAVIYLLIFLFGYIVALYFNNIKCLLINTIFFLIFPMEMG